MMPHNLQALLRLRLGTKTVLFRRQILASASRASCMHSSLSASSFSWEFPPPTPAPSLQELRLNGLPLLNRALQHAYHGRTLLMSGRKHEDGTTTNTVDTVSYMDVLLQAKYVAKFLTELNVPEPSTTPYGRPKLAAHLNVPGWEYIATQWGIFGSGFGSVPLALTQKPKEMEHVLTDSNPHIIFAGGGCRLHKTTSTSSTHVPPNTDDLIQAAKNVGMEDRIVYLKDIFQPLSQQECTIHGNARANAKDDIPESQFWLGRSGVVPSLDEPALILYTSGTTGKPKGVVITHRNIFHQITDLVTSWEWEQSDVALHVLPLHHVHGVINILSCAAYVGARLEFQPFHAETLWKQWASDESTLPKPTVFMAVPTIYAKLLEAAANLPKETVTKAFQQTLSPMRLMVSGSAALPISVLEKWRSLTGHTLLERYGMTEFAMALSNPYRKKSSEDSTQIRRPGYVGRPLPSVAVRLMDQATEEVIETPGVSGELQVKGPTVFQKYLNRPDATKEAFTDDGYFRTGDIAQYDGDGIESFRILGRASVDIIKSGGYKLSALEIERELLEHPDIAEVAILGLPDDTWGERVAMICRLNSGAPEMTLEGLRIWSKDRLSKYKIPSRLLIVSSEIPKNAMGKINKKNLAGLFSED